MMELKRILLVEDNANDVELTLSALAEHHLANEVLVVRDGAEALDYLYRRGKFVDLPPGHPARPSPSDTPASPPQTLSILSLWPPVLP